MKRRILLLVWLLGILFPLAWLGNFSARYHDVFCALFTPEWMHWVMHAGLYAGLATMLLWVFDWPAIRKTLGWILAITWGVGLLQEGLQLFSGVQILRWNTLFDLGIDSLGAIIGFGVVAGLKIRPSRFVKHSKNHEGQKPGRP